MATAESLSLKKEAMVRNGIIVCGPRDFTDTIFIYKELARMIIPFARRQGNEGIIIIHGDCEGVDKIADTWARANGFKVSVHPAEWDKYGNGAGPVRNAKMAQLPFAYGCVGFVRDPITRGTCNMMNVAKASGLVVKKINIK